jgi:hypothetical protein
MACGIETMVAEIYKIIHNRVYKTLLVCILCTSFYNVNAQILAADTANNASLGILKQEVEVFSTIRNGLYLSVAECELFDQCNANVNKGEIEQLLGVIDNRINLLSARYTVTTEADLESILVSYVDVRDGYSNILQKMESLPQFEHQLNAADIGIDLYGSDATTGEVPDNLLRLFMDTDNDLVDDDIIIDDEL